jgi:hypothetical protein
MKRSATELCRVGLSSVLMVLFAFGVGLANFASGRDMSPTAVVSAIADEMAVVASYGSTGNVAVEDGDVDEIRRRLTTVTGTAWAVVSSERLDDGLRTLGTMPSPQPSTQEERATPGLAFAVTMRRDGPLVSTERAVLHRLGIDSVECGSWTFSTARGSTAIVAEAAGGGGFRGHQPAGRRSVDGSQPTTLDGLRARVEATRR